jgi:hypothetical protein
MRGFVFVASLLALLCAPFAPAVARGIQDWGLNGPSEDPPVPADRGVILGTVANTVKTLGLISQPLRLQFVIKEPAPGQFAPDGMPKARFYFDYDDHEQASAPPGEYALSSAHWSSEVVTWQIGGWLRAEPVGAFKLAAGEVIYIGHLVIEPGNTIFGGSKDNKLLKMTVEDRFEEYRKELPPHLRDVVQKRLITLPAEIVFEHAERHLVR